MKIKSVKKQLNPRQQQNRPGSQKAMHPEPDSVKSENPAGKIINKVALITGGDSGIGRAVAILFAREGADIAIAYFSEHRDAQETARMVEGFGKRCLAIPGDLSNENHCKTVIKHVIKQFGKLNILVNNAAIHYESKSIAEITTRHLIRTFSTNVFSMFWITKYALLYMKRGDCIINTSSVTAYRGSPKLIDYSSTKGAIVSFTRSLSSNLIKKGIRVNGVAPGPIWTPLIVSSFSAKKVSEHGDESPMERPGQPSEVAPCFLFLASEESSYISGQFIHPNGGEIING